ncbi:DMT family transporter [Streptococcus sciuri]|uniref:DMT family transporter n=1 Tax=Streptococcus sciuri TaxID=2973939 RepID=A0ABT2F878_9STRE|nr:DMT family transporter [Streptococcus sciuri]MCS4488672.1 DMT family transporter [Streptococcus sciuri]
MSKQGIGVLLTLVAGIAWGLSGTSGQYLISHGLAINALSSVRLLLSGFFLLGIEVVSDAAKVKSALRDRGFLVTVLIFSCFGLVANQYAYLKAIFYTNAGTATVLQYMAPIIIIVLASLKKRQLPKWVEVFSIFLAVFGTFIMATHGHLSRLSLSPTGLFWGIFSAFTYVAYILLPINAIRKWGSLLVLGVSMLFGGVLFSILTQAWTYHYPLDEGSLLAYIGIIGVGTLFAYTAFLKGTTIIGAVKGSLLASVEPISSVLLTVLLFGEHFYISALFGMLLIILAVMLISIQDLLMEKIKEKGVTK